MSGPTGRGTPVTGRAGPAAAEGTDGGRGDPPPVRADVDQRTRILDAALTLVSDLGATGTSMRQVAAACGLNVATIYHYFPSKASLLEAVIEERRYGERMAVEAPPIDDGLTPRPRLAQLVRWVIAESLEEETILRLLVGEGLRRDPTARRSATALVDALDRALVAWIGPAFPELRERGIDPPLVAHLIRRTLLAVVIEHLATGSTDAQASADELAAIVFG